MLFDFCLFELIFLLIHWWSPNGSKSRPVSDFVINYCWNCLESEGRETKKHDFWTQFVSFWSFSNFWKFTNRLQYQLKEMFLINYQYLRGYATFLLKLWHTIKQILNIHYNALMPGTLFGMYLQLYKVLLSKNKWILSYRGLKKSYFTW